ncbi:MAG: SUMF1/EgtB/PvdO family nonheme iron enzyme [Kiritimatiellae bacterium]|nr:SUMF1/EgtB/PvdO family nonheme iron enzyme [Kiritimatiellia bacterium]
MSWFHDGTAALYRVEITTELQASNAWKAAGAYLPTGQWMSVRLNVTNAPMRFYRVWADTSTAFRTRHAMVLVPGGVFAMGNTYGDPALVEGWPRELPVHDVPVSPFLMDKYEVSNEKAAEVFQWAYTNNLLGVNPIDAHPHAQVVNLEGVTQTLYRLDQTWSQIGFTNGAFYVKNNRTNFPIIGITWYGAQAYANYRSDMEGLPRAIGFAVTNWSMNLNAGGYRLPTEAEWEKACRGGIAGTHFPWPNDSVYGPSNYLYNIDVVKANYADGRYQPWTNQPPHPWYFETIATTPVGYYDGRQQIDFSVHPLTDWMSGADAGTTQDMANAYGLYDMGGNAWEWCWDWYATNWYSSPSASLPDPVGETNRANIDPPVVVRDLGAKILRGGGWYPVSLTFGSDPTYLRCAYREGQWPDVPMVSAGFRLARSIR